MFYLKETDKKKTATNTPDWLNLNKPPWKGIVSCRCGFTLVFNPNLGQEFRSRNTYMMKYFVQTKKPSGTQGMLAYD